MGANVAALQAALATAPGAMTGQFHFPAVAAPMRHPLAAAAPITHEHQTDANGHADANGSLVDDKKKKRKRSNRKEKGLDAFRQALLHHLEQHARLSPAAASGSQSVQYASPASPEQTEANGSNSHTGLPPDAAVSGAPSAASSDGVSASQRQAWLREYEARIADFGIKALVQESVRFRFPCSPFVILVPNWHALREALWLFLKSIGVKKAKRSVSTKQDLIDICIQPDVKFDFSEFVKDAESHGNRKPDRAAAAAAAAAAEEAANGASRPLKKRIKKEHITEEEHAAEEVDDDAHIATDGSIGEESSSSIQPVQPSPTGSIAGGASSTNADRKPITLGLAALHADRVKSDPFTSLTSAPPAAIPVRPAKAKPAAAARPPAALPQTAPAAASSPPPIMTANEVIHHFLNLPPTEYHSFKTWFYINIVQRENPPPVHSQQATVQTNAPQASTHTDQRQQQAQNAAPMQTQPHHFQPHHHQHQLHHPAQMPHAQPVQPTPVQAQPPHHYHHYTSPMPPLAHIHQSHPTPSNGAIMHSVPTTPLQPPMTPSQYLAHDTLRPPSAAGASAPHHDTSAPTQQHSAGAAFHQWSNTVLMTPLMGPGGTPNLHAHGTVATPTPHVPPTPSHLHPHAASPMHPSARMGASPSALFSPSLLGHDPSHLANSSAAAAHLAAQQAAHANSQAAKLQHQLQVQQQRLEKLRGRAAAAGARGQHEEDESDDDEDDDEDDEDADDEDPNAIDGVSSSDDDDDDNPSALPKMVSLGTNGISMPPPPSASVHLSRPSLTSPLLKRTIVNLATMPHSHAHSHFHSPNALPSMPSPSLHDLYRAAGTRVTTSAAHGMEAAATISSLASHQPAMTHAPPSARDHAAATDVDAPALHLRPAPPGGSFGMPPHARMHDDARSSMATNGVMTTSASHEHEKKSPLD